MIKKLPQRLAAWFTTRLKDKKGVAAVEFAFILPLMVTLFFGVIETSNAIIADRKVTNLTSTVADLVAQTKTVNDAEIQDIFNAAAAILVPFDTAELTIVVSSIVIDGDGNATVDWSSAGPDGGTPRTAGSSMTLPTGLNIPNTSLIVSEVNYTHRSLLQYFIKSGISLSDIFYLRPRMSDQVTKT
jgi:Flp pilus assembly protein TadG